MEGIVNLVLIKPHGHHAFPVEGLKGHSVSILVNVEHGIILLGLLEQLHFLGLHLHSILVIDFVELDALLVSCIVSRRVEFLAESCSECVHHFPLEELLPQVGFLLLRLLLLEKVVEVVGGLGQVKEQVKRQVHAVDYLVTINEEVGGHNTDVDG